jgi:malonyl CoA-acyl carrier protein transacylase
VPSKLATAALFPGQGCSLAGVKPLVVRHCEHLYSLCCGLVGDDPFDRAEQSTRYAQPAIFLASLAGWRSMRPVRLETSAFAGHSLGELAALTAAGVWSEADGLRLVILRASLMADAASGDDGGMLAVLKGDLAGARQLADRFGVALANDNAVGQTVLSGPRAALNLAARAAREAGLRTIALDVAGAFHSPSMTAAVEPFARALRAVRPKPPSAPVFSGLTAEPFTDIPAQLSDALCASVRWRETMLALDRFGIERYVDVGPDEVLARLVQRNLPHPAIVRGEELGVAA